MSEPSKITPEFVAEVQRRMADMEARNTHLEAHLRVSEMLRADLERMLKHERHTRWGATSETLGEDQRHLPFEDIEVVQGMLEQASAEAEKATRKGPQAPKPRRSNKGNLPEHLPREETVIEPETTDCPCGCGEMEPIGEDRSDRLDSEPFSAIGPRTMASPAQFRDPFLERPKYMCRACQGKSHAEAPAPDYLVPRGLPTEALMAHMLVAKFGDHLPFYRQS
ncbi:MAG: IS66 family transposase, partial [Pseudomonadota bacterium]